MNVFETFDALINYIIEISVYNYYNEHKSNNYIYGV